MSTDEGSSVSRRRFLRAASATAGTAAIAGQASAAEDGGEGGEGSVEPDFSYLGGVDGGYTDARGESEVTVEVGAEGNGGAYAFAPAGIWVDPGTTVKWDWVDGRHNVVAEDGPASLDSGDPVGDSGVQYEYTFEEGGITNYFCAPHKGQGMKGAVAVGEDVPTVSVGGGSSVLPDSAKALGVAGAGALAGTLGLGYLFIKYGGRGAD